MAFMRLVGIFQLKIGSEVVLQDKENEAFTFESSLENANKVNNPEAIFFLSEYVSFKSRKIAQTGMSPPETKKPLPMPNLLRSEVALSPQTRKPMQKHEDETQESLDFVSLVGKDRPTEAELDRHSFALRLPGMEERHISLTTENSPHDVEKQKLALYKKWLSVCPSASWSDVVQALEDVGEFTIANEIKNNIRLALMPVQFENIELSGDIADRLMDLNTEFVSLTIEVKEKVEQKPKILKTLISHVEEEAFQINLKSIKNSAEFFAAIRPHYNFIDCLLNGKPSAHLVRLHCR